MLHSSIFGKSRYLRYINRIQSTYCEPRKGSNDAQLYTVACKTHTMCTILWPSQHASKRFEISFQALFGFQQIKKRIQDRETNTVSDFKPRNWTHMFE